MTEFQNKEADCLQTDIFTRADAESHIHRGGKYIFDGVPKPRVTCWQRKIHTKQHLITSVQDCVFVVEITEQRACRNYAFAARKASLIK